MKGTVTVVVELLVDVQVEAESPSAAIKDAISLVDEEGYNAGMVEAVTTKLDRVQFGKLDADISSSLETKAVLEGDYTRRYTVRPYLLGDSAPRLDRGSYADAMDSLDEWVEEAAACAS